MPDMAFLDYEQLRVIVLEVPPPSGMPALVGRRYELAVKKP